MIKYLCIFRLVLRCLLVAKKDNSTGFSTGLTGRSKNLDPTGNPTGAGRPDRFQSLLHISKFRLVLRCFAVARKENLTGFSTGLTGRSKNLDPTGNPTGRSTRPVPVDPIGFHL